MQALDTEGVLTESLRRLGWQVDAEPSGPLERYDLLVTRPEVLHRWRVGGLHTPALVRCPRVPELPRSALEPVAWVLDERPTTLSEALQALERGQRNEQLRIGAITIDLATRLVHGPDREARLTQREADLLGYLAARSEREVSRDELLRQVWGHPRPRPGKTVDMAVYRLRKKVEPDPNTPSLLISSYGGGYRLVLPAPSATPFVGRSLLVGSLLQRVQRAPLTRLIGPSGVGKTRLAAEVASRCPLRVLHVELDGAEGFSPIGAALSVRLPHDSDPDTVATRLAAALLEGGPLLLWLDDADAAGTAIEALSRIEGLHLLVTCQRSDDPEAIGVPPLGGPEMSALLEALAPGCQVPDALLERLDGLPLAGELLARLLPHLSTEALLERAERLPAVLDTPGAHRGGLQQALAWGWEQLDGEDRELLRSLAWFSGGFEVDALEAVAGPAGLAALPTLVRSGWLREEGRRYRLLHPIRAFLRSLPGDPTAFVTWAVQAASVWLEHEGTEQADATAIALTGLRPDLERALELALEADDADWLVPLGAAVDGIDARFGTPKTRLDRLDRLSTACGGRLHRFALDRLRSTAYQDMAAASKALEARGRLALDDDPDLGWRILGLAASYRRWGSTAHEALQLLEGLPDQGGPGVTMGHVQRLNLQAYAGEISAEAAGRAQAGFTERYLVDGRTLDALLAGRMAVFWIDKAGDPAWADRLLQRLCALAPRVGDARLTYLLLAQRAFTARTQNRFADALDHIEAAMEVVDRVEPARMQNFRQYRGSLLLHLGRLEEAEQELLRSLDWARSIGSTGEEASIWMVLTQVYALQDRLDAALDAATRGEAVAADQMKPMLASQRGLVHHLRGELDLARAAYDRARTGHPALEAEVLARRTLLARARAEPVDALLSRLKAVVSGLAGVRDAVDALAVVHARLDDREPTITAGSADVRLLARL